MELTVCCDICGEPVELPDDVCGCKGCGRAMGPCCESSRTGFCFECLVFGEEPDEEDES